MSFIFWSCFFFPPKTHWNKYQPLKKIYLSGLCWKSSCMSSGVWLVIYCRSKKNHKRLRGMHMLENTVVLVNPTAKDHTAWGVWLWSGVEFAIVSEDWWGIYFSRGMKWKISEESNWIEIGWDIENSDGSSDGTGRKLKTRWEECEMGLLDWWQCIVTVNRKWMRHPWIEDPHFHHLKWGKGEGLVVGWMMSPQKIYPCPNRQSWWI